LQSDNELPSSVLIYRKLEKELVKEIGADERRESFHIFIDDGSTGRRVRFPLPGLIGPWFHLRLIGVDQHSGLQSWSNYALELKLFRSSLFRGLQKKELAAAQWLGSRAITFECQRRERVPIYTLTATQLRHLHGMRRQCERVERELGTMIEPVKRMMSHTLSDEVDMHDELQRAVSYLRRFQQRARLAPSRTRALEFQRNRLRSFWMFRPPAIAYALFRLLTEHSEPSLLRKKAYCRIGTFEREYLGRKSRSVESDPEDTVRRQVYTFKRSTKRKQMDGILNRLIAGDWYCLDHPLNCDWENPKTLPLPSR
jgi:hypothetical protein